MVKMLQPSKNISNNVQGGRDSPPPEGEADNQEDSISYMGQVKDEELAHFRAKWYKELDGAQDLPQAQTTKQDIDEDSDEEKARLLFIKGVENEQKGKLYEAIQFYRKAVQLVPDIEFRLYESTSQRLTAESGKGKEKEYSIDNGIEEDNLDLLDEAEIDEFDPTETDLFSHLHRILSRTYCVCQPKVPQKTVHISSLPIEIILHILRWVVSSDLDLRSLEMTSAVCRGLYVCSRDPEIWRLACVRVWGANCGGLYEFKSWRQMFISRPHIHFNGCYISRTTYVRHGENSFQDQFYRPWHFVEYYRYLRFFPEGLVLMLTTTENPITCVGLLKARQVRQPSIMVGHYRLTGNMVNLTVQKQESSRIRSRKSNSTPEQTFHLEFDIVSRQAVKHSQLRWCSYSVYTQYQSGVGMTSAFDVAGSKYPPFWFSRVKSYTIEADHPLM